MSNACQRHCSRSLPAQYRSRDKIAFCSRFERGGSQNSEEAKNHIEMRLADALIVMDSRRVIRVGNAITTNTSNSRSLLEALLKDR